MLISDEYRELNRLLHQQSAKYGTKGHRDSDLVLKYIRLHGVVSILDYGSGKGGLKEALRHSPLPMKVLQYEPALQIDERTPCDLVVCRYVLEHVEPECVDDVLADIRRLSRRFAILSIGCKASADTLPDGSNTHRSIYPAKWWEQKLKVLFKKATVVAHNKGCSVEAVC